MQINFDISSAHKRNTRFDGRIHQYVLCSTRNFFLLFNTVEEGFPNLSGEIYMARELEASKNFASESVILLLLTIKDPRRLIWRKDESTILVSLLFGQESRHQQNVRLNIEIETNQSVCRTNRQIQIV